MKRIAMLVCCLCLLVSSAARGGAAEDEAPFRIDALHAYGDMVRCYAQNYMPTVKNDTVSIVLPLFSDECEGDVTAVFAPADAARSPVKLSPKQAVEKTFSRQSVRFGEETLSVYKIAFELALYRSRVNGEYPYTVTVRGANAAGEPLEQVFPLVMRIADGAENFEIPMVSVTSCSVGAAHLQAGEAGEILLTLQNQSATRAIEQLNVSFSGEEIYPQGSNVTRLGRLEAGESAVCVIPIRTGTKAAAQAHALNFTMDYAYDGDKRASASETFYADVRQAAALSCTQVSFPVRVTQGNTPAFSVTLVNVGRSDLSNIVLSFDIPGLSGGQDVVGGTLAVGENKTLSANFRLDADFLGETSGTATVSYEDAYGEMYAATISLATLVEAKVVPALSAQSEEEEAPSPFTWIPYALAGFLLLLLLAQGGWLRRKIRILEERNL